MKKKKKLEECGFCGGTGMMYADDVTFTCTICNGKGYGYRDDPEENQTKESTQNYSEPKLEN